MNFKDVPLSSSVSFRNSVLVGADLSNKDFNNIDFSNANLSSTAYIEMIKYLNIFS